MKALCLTVLCFLAVAPLDAMAQNCCAPAVPQQGVLGETVALPHTLEIGLHYEYLRARGLYDGSEEIPDPTDTRTVWTRGTLTLGYGILPGLSVTAIVPYIYKEKTIFIAAKDAVFKYTADGIADISAFVRYSPLARSFVNYREFTVGIGVKLPTGSVDRRRDGFLLPEELQPGTGSWDFQGMISFYQGYELADFYLSATYLYTTEHDSYEFGDQFSYLLSSIFHIADRIDISTALSGSTRRRDHQNGEEVFSTGRHQMWLVSGIQLQVVPNSLRLQLYYEEPIYQHFNGIQLGSDNNIRLSVAYTLPLANSETD